MSVLWQFSQPRHNFYLLCTMNWVQNILQKYLYETSLLVRLLYLWILKKIFKSTWIFSIKKQTKAVRQRVLCINVSYVMEFLAWWVLKSKVFAPNQLYSNEIAVFCKNTKSARIVLSMSIFYVKDQQKKL